MSNEDLVRQLIPLAQRDSRAIARQERFSFLSAFVARRTETVQSISMPVAGLLVVLEGIKQIWWSARKFTYGPGAAFALPAGASVDVVNQPDPRTGVYRALFLGFSHDLLTEARRRWSGLAAGAPSDPGVEITPALESAILHTCEALAGTIAVSDRVTEQRILEVLLLMAEAGAAPLRPDMKTASVTDNVRFIVRCRPAHAWSAAKVAAELHTSEPTLRRHLRQEGSSFRQIVADERMQAARFSLLDGGANITQAAMAGGYASLSHFSRRFRDTFGCLPSRVQYDAADANRSERDND